MSKAYGFHGFVLKPEELSLYHKEERLELGLKGFKLLVALVENQGKLIPKDELISAAWGEQIVTDGTLSKQMERMRQVLGENGSDITFVETVRGIGYKFIPEVKILISRKKGLAKWQKAIATVIIIPLVLFLYFYPFKQESTEATEKSIMPFNIAVIPAAAGEDYMNQGGIEYLSKLLGRNPRIYHTSPRASWFKHEDKYKLAIELEDQKYLDFVLMVNIKDKQDYKVAALELRNTNQFNKQEIIKARSFKQLFADINTWMLLQLEIENKSKDYIEFNNMSADSFAAESYLRGKQLAAARVYSKAIPYYKTAVTQDPEFDLAQLDLARAYMHSSNYSAAESLLTTLESSRSLNDYLKLYLLTLKAGVYSLTLRTDEIKRFIDETINLAKKIKDERALVLAYYYQGEMFLMSGDMQSSIQSTLKQKEIVEANSKNKADLMRIASNLSNDYYRINEFEKAKELTMQTVEFLKIRSRPDDILDSYNNLAAINYELAEFQQGLNNINKAKAVQSKVEDQNMVRSTLEISAYIQLELGLHDQCRDTIKQMEDMAIATGVKSAQYLATFIETELNLRSNNFTSLKESSQYLEKVIHELGDSYLFYTQVALVTIIQINIKLKNYDAAQLKLDALFSTLKNDKTINALSHKILSYDLLYKTGKKNEAKTKLEKMLTTYTNKKHNRMALFVAYLLLEYDQDNNFKNSLNILNQIKYIKPFPYPYLKYKAKLAAYNGDYFEASTLMQEMKNTSYDWFNTEDQILMDSYFAKIKQ